LTAYRVDVVTLFRAAFDGWRESGGIGRTAGRGLLDLHLIDLRQFGIGRHLQVDDAPFGGGPGMVLRPEPLFAAVESIAGHKEGPIILLSPRGRRFSQADATALVRERRLTLIAGHYEGVDERVGRHLATDEFSIGDYVLSGGETAAMVVIEAIARLLPGAIDAQSALEESFVSGLLEYPQYTRPASFRGWGVPDVLTSGDHAKVKAWRAAAATEKTRSRRPDLLPERES
jgi:tRNA (guanine37-N1)-methyltransferase